MTSPHTYLTIATLTIFITPGLLCQARCASQRCLLKTLQVPNGPSSPGEGINIGMCSLSFGRVAGGLQQGSHQHNAFQLSL